MEAIALTEDAAFLSLRLTLDGADYLLSLAWSQREEKWYLSLADGEDVPIVSGVKVVADYPLLSLSHHDSRCPPGELMATDTTGQGLDPHFADMSGDAPRVVLVYIPAAEVETILG